MSFRAGKYGFWGPALVLAVWLTTTSGCAVPQKPGKGYCTRLVEPETRTGYWLYLPEDYVANRGQHPTGRRWPMVVTFHGLRPYDDANPQIREWQEEADRYGYVVIAPELRTCDSLYMQYPLRNPEFSYIRKDERAVLAVIDEVARRTNADPSRVLATSFSSGGYLAHLMVNRHPERFTCLAVRGSNFSERLLDPAQISKYRDMKIGIFFGEHDFKVCRDESIEAVDWYRRHRFDVTARKVGGMGHERKPEVAAALFADVIGITPKTPPDLGPLVMLDVIPNDWRTAASQRRERSAPRATAEPEPAVSEAAAFSPPSPTPASPQPVTPRTQASVPTAQPAAPSGAGSTPGGQPAPSATRVVPRRTETPKRPASPTPAPDGSRTAPRGPERTRPPLVFAKREQFAPPTLPANLRLHGEPIGEAPMWVSLSVELPDELKDGATVLWTENNRPLAALHAFETQVLLKEPGDHDIEAHVITADDRKTVLRQTITVLGPATGPAH